MIRIETTKNGINLSHKFRRRKWLCRCFVRFKLNRERNKTKYSFQIDFVKATFKPHETKISSVGQIFHQLFMYRYLWFSDIWWYYIPRAREAIVKRGWLFSWCVEQWPISKMTDGPNFALRWCMSPNRIFLFQPPQSITGLNDMQIEMV